MLSALLNLGVEDEDSLLELRYANAEALALLCGACTSSHARAQLCKKLIGCDGTDAASITDSDTEMQNRTPATALTQAPIPMQTLLTLVLMTTLIPTPTMKLPHCNQQCCRQQ